jgi:hypothetical protein
MPIELSDDPQSLEELRPLELELLLGLNVRIGHPHCAGDRDGYANVVLSRHGS